VLDSNAASEFGQLACPGDTVEVAANPRRGLAAGRFVPARRALLVIVSVLEGL
jgi:hypothetical protein